MKFSHFNFLSSLSLLSLNSLSINAQTCNVETSGIDLVNIISGDLKANELKVIRPATFDEGKVTIVDNVVGGITASFWFLEKQRLTDGFSVTFDFTISGGKTDGFAFVIQNDKIQDIQGGIGNNLGFRNGLENYVAVGFDVCTDRTGAATCNPEAVFVEFKKPGQNSQTILTQAFGQNNVLKTGSHTAKVNYLQDELKLNVFIDGAATPFASAQLDETLEELFGERFAFFGFTASNFPVQPARSIVENFNMKSMNADSRLADDFKPVKSVEFGKQVRYKFVLTDSCDLPLDAAGVEARGVFPENITATLSRNIADTPDERAIVLEGQLSTNNDGSFNIFFNMPVNIVDDWDLDIFIGPIQAQNMPQFSVLETVDPEAGGISQQTIILLACVIAVLLVVTVYMVRRLDKYRQKLKEHKEDIEYGKTKEQIDKVDATLTYVMNPMIAPLDEMKERLSRNMEILERLKNGQEEAQDSNYTIDQLMKENDQLRNEMNNLKKEEQLREANQGGVAGKGGRKFGEQGRKEFDQQRGE